MIYQARLRGANWKLISFVDFLTERNSDFVVLLIIVSLFYHNIQISFVASPESEG